MRSNKVAALLFSIAGVVFLVEGVVATPRRSAYVILGIAFLVIATGIRRRMRTGPTADDPR